MPSTWLFLCRVHHAELGSRPSQSSLVTQLAWKLWNDIEHYDCAAVVKLYRPNCKPEFVAEIEAAVKKEYAIIVRNYR